MLSYLSQAQGVHEQPTLALCFGGANFASAPIPPKTKHAKSLFMSVGTFHRSATRHFRSISQQLSYYIIITLHTSTKLLESTWRSKCHTNIATNQKWDMYWRNSCNLWLCLYLVTAATVSHSLRRCSPQANRRHLKWCGAALKTLARVEEQFWKYQK